MTSLFNGVIELDTERGKQFGFTLTSLTGIYGKTTNGFEQTKECFSEANEWCDVWKKEPPK